MSTLGLMVFLVCASSASQPSTLRPSAVVVVVLSQADQYHSTLALSLRADLQQQAAVSKEAPIVHLSHEEFRHPGAWTVIPLLAKLQEVHGKNSSWIVFCEEKTRINLQRLLTALSLYDHTKEAWLGHGLHDQEPTIIHHFANAEDPKRFFYPLLSAGFAISVALLKSLSSKAAAVQKSDFSIDAMHELAVFTNTPLLSLPSVFCLKNETDCATYPLPFSPCGKALPTDALFFAVKTCLKHHTDRVPVVQQTWAREATHIEFFSDVGDELIPTTSVGVVNTERGHCAKTLAILNLVTEQLTKLPNLQWLVLADDDTLLSVSRLQSLLHCWDGRFEELVVGERYGYNIATGIGAGVGYNYPTGGGGLAVSRALLPTLARECYCPAQDSPDDMYLGLCLARLNKTLVHSSAFHQARPADYARDYLATQLPVSFHKHWMLDPVSTYKQWLSAHDYHLHTEL